LKGHEASVSTKDLCRKHGMSDVSFYKWKAKFGGMDVSDAKRLRALEAGNAKLKKLVVHLFLDKMMLEDVLKKL